MVFADLLIDLTIQFNGVVRRAASKLQLTASQAYLIFIIPPNGISMSVLAFKLGIDNSTLTRNIQKLENSMLVARKGSSYDKRISNVFLTTLGKETAISLENLLNEICLDIAEKLDLDIQNSLVEILEKLNWNMECLSEESQ